MRCLALIAACALAGCASDPTCADGVTQQEVPLCTLKPGRAEVLEKVAPDTRQLFIAREAAAPPFPAGFSRFTDLDGDGDLDVVTRRPTQTIASFRRESDGSYTLWQPLGGGYWPEVCDVNRDGHPDVLALHTTATRTLTGLFINDGTGKLIDETAARIPLGVIAGATACADLDSDGAPELLVAPWDGRAVLLANAGNGSFSIAQTLDRPENFARWVVAGDLDADGDADFVIGGTEGTSRVLLSTAGRLAVSPTPLEATDLWAGGALGDIDEDRDLDLVTGTRESVRVWVNDGAGRFSDASERVGSPLTVPSVVNIVGLIDFDADGDLDIDVAGAKQPVLFNTLRDEVARDTTPPELFIDEPVDGTAAHVPPFIDLRFADTTSGVRPGSLRVTLNGRDVTEQLQAGFGTLVVPPDGLDFVPGENVLRAELRDLAGNGLRRTSTFTLEARARPFSAHLEVHDESGRPRNNFRSDEPLFFQLRHRNGGGASLQAHLSCHGGSYRVFDGAGHFVWAPDVVCPRVVLPPTRIKPCTEWSETSGWSQTRFWSDELVKRGAYSVRACLSGPVFPGYRSPAGAFLNLE